MPEADMILVDHLLYNENNLELALKGYYFTFHMHRKHNIYKCQMQKLREIFSKKEVGLKSFRIVYFGEKC